MANLEIPKTFDWVTARSKCNADEMFKRLLKVVTSDVDTANGINPIRIYRIDLISEREFAVVLPHISGMGFTKGVTFLREGSEIQVRQLVKPQKLIFSVRAYLLDGEDCTFAVNEKPLEPWQVSRLALEDVIFDD